MGGLFLALIMMVMMLPTAAAVSQGALQDCRVTFLSDGSYDLMLLDSTTTRSWKGYKLFTMYRSENYECGEEEGPKHKHTDDCYSYNYVVNDKFTEILTGVANANKDWPKGKDWSTVTVTEDNLIDYINGLKGTTNIQKFAENVYNEIKKQESGLNLQEKVDFVTAESTGDGKFDVYVDQGYWLFADVTENAKEEFVNSLVFLDTSGEKNIVVRPKVDVPTVEKEVSPEDGELGEHTSVSVNDKVYFELTATLPKNLAEYETYKLVFHDTLSDGLTYCGDNDVAVYVKKGNAETKVKEDGFTVKSGTDADPGDTLTVTLDDVNVLTDDQGNKITVDKDSKILVKYHATLNEDAVIGNPGNENKVYLEYSNRPGTDSIGETPEKIVKVFTFQLTVKKVDGNWNELSGADFELYKWDDVQNKYVEVGKAGTTVTEPTTFEWTGLGAGKYKLVETEAPKGYNKAEDIIFSIKYTTKEGASGLEIDEVTFKDGNDKPITDKFTVEKTNKGEISTKIVNEKGSTLPSTGGMGTTVFYVVGPILMVGAAVLLITKKRMRDQSDE